MTLVKMPQGSKVGYISEKSWPNMDKHSPPSRQVFGNQVRLSKTIAGELIPTSAIPKSISTIFFFQHLGIQIDVELQRFWLLPLLPTKNSWSHALFGQMVHPNIWMMPSAQSVERAVESDQSLQIVLRASMGPNTFTGWWFEALWKIWVNWDD